jgi:hypothetical protein
MDIVNIMLATRCYFKQWLSYFINSQMPICNTQNLINLLHLELPAKRMLSSSTCK